jgi:hypothetical protein
MRIRASKIYISVLITAATNCALTPGYCGDSAAIQKPHDNKHSEDDPPAILVSPDDLTRMRLLGEDNYYRYLENTTDKQVKDSIRNSSCKSFPN